MEKILQFVLVSFNTNLKQDDIRHAKIEQKLFKLKFNLKTTSKITYWK